MKNRIYNIAIIILVILLVLVVEYIFYHYTKIDSNHEDLTKFAQDAKKQIEEQIKEENLENIPVEENNKNSQKVELKYKGFDVLGIIKIPKINLEYPILDTTNDKTMSIAITKFWGNNVNDIGNFSMAGHNYYNGVFFGNTKKLENGDIIQMTDLTGRMIEYEVFKKYVIDPNDVSCVKSVDGNTREITLITCTNGRKNRLIVKAREKIKE